MAASSRSSSLKRELARAAGALVTLCALWLPACSVGHGSGELSGTLYIAGCRREGPYTLAPDAFFSQTFEKLLSIRVQRGGDIEVYSDGITVLVNDASRLKRELLGKEIDLAGRAEPLVAATAFFNETCPSQRRKVPVLLEAVSGSIRFDAIYAPLVAKREVRISAELTQVVFRDPDQPDDRWAELSGSFDFLYVRGSPAQPFP